MVDRTRTVRYTNLSPKRLCWLHRRAGAARSMPGKAAEAAPAEEAPQKPPTLPAISLARQCEEVARLKANALAAEDYDVAKRVKAVEEVLTVLLTRETELKKLKAEAVWLEDFEGASAIQHQLQTIDTQARAEMRKMELIEAHQRGEVKGGSDGKADTGKSDAAASGVGSAKAAGGAKQPSPKGKGAGKATAAPPAGDSKLGSPKGKRPGKPPTAQPAGESKRGGKAAAAPPAGGSKSGGKVGVAAAAAAFSKAGRGAAAAKGAGAAGSKGKGAAALERVQQVFQLREQSSTIIAGAYRSRRNLRRTIANTILVYAMKRFLLRARARRKGLAAVQVQSRARGAASRMLRARCVSSIGVLHAMARRWLLHRKRLRRRAASVVLYNHLRELRAAKVGWASVRAGLKLMISSSLTIQTASRGMQQRARKQLSVNMAVRLQAGARARVARLARVELLEEQLERTHAADVVRRFFEMLAQGQAVQDRISAISATLRRASATIQAAGRRWLTRRRDAQMREAGAKVDKAADIVISFLDHCIARQSLLGRMQRIVFEARMASQKLQAGLRGMADRRKSVAIRQENAATAKLQAGLRGMAGRRKSVVMRQSIVNRLQAHARGMAGRRKSVAIRESRDQQAAGTALQAGMRGMVARRRSVVIRERQQDASASQKLQAAVRGRLGRRKSVAVRLGIVRVLAAEKLNAFLRGALTRTRMRHAADDAAVTPPVDVVMRLRCAPIARDANELTRQIVRLLRESGDPPLRLRPNRLTVRPASTLLTASGALPTSGGEHTDDAIVLIMRVHPGPVPGEVSAADGAAALMRIPAVTFGLGIGATLAAPLHANLVVSPPFRRPPAGTSGAAVESDSAAGTHSAAIVSYKGVTYVEDGENVVNSHEAGRAASEGRRAHAAHTLLHYVRSLERTPPPPPVDNSPEAAALALPPPEPYVSRPELLAALGVLLPLAREALHAARLSSTQRLEADAEAGDALALGLHVGHASSTSYFRGEATAVRGFVALQRPSPFEAAPRGPAVAGRKLRWVSHRVEICCPPSPYATYDLDGVIEDGASGAVMAYATLAQPIVRAALRGVSGNLIVVGDGAAASSLALFGELAHPSRMDGALVWAAGAARGGAGGARRLGLAGLVVAELLAEPGRWQSGTNGGGDGDGRSSDGPAAHARSPTSGGSVSGADDAGWRVHCSAFQITAGGVVDLLQHPPQSGGFEGGYGGGATAGQKWAGEGSVPWGLVGLREWRALDGSVSGGSYTWPHGLSRVGIQSPLDFSEVLATALGRRLELSMKSGSSDSPDAWRKASKAIPQPPVCAPMALVLEVEGTTPEGDATSAQIVLWDLPGVVPMPTPPRGASVVSSSALVSSGLAASMRSATSEIRAVSNGMHALRSVFELLGKPSVGGGSENEAAAALAARSHPLSLILWRALAGDGLTTCLTLAAASEWQLPATLEAVQFAHASRQLQTRPRPRRTRAAPTLDDLTALLDEAEQRRAEAARDVAQKSTDSTALAPEDWYDLPARMGYDNLLRELDQLLQMGAGADMEAAVLRKLTRRLLGDVRKLRNTQPLPATLGSDDVTSPASPQPRSPFSPDTRSVLSPRGSSVSVPLPSATAAARAASFGLTPAENVLLHEDAASTAIERTRLAANSAVAQERARAEAAEEELQRRSAQLRDVKGDLAHAEARAATLERERVERDWNEREGGAHHRTPKHSRAIGASMEAADFVDSAPTSTGGGSLFSPGVRSPGYSPLAMPSTLPKRRSGHHRTSATIDTPTNSASASRPSRGRESRGTSGRRVARSSAHAQRQDQLLNQMVRQQLVDSAATRAYDHVTIDPMSEASRAPRSRSQVVSVAPPPFVQVPPR